MSRTPLCDRLYEFIDGELSDSDAQEFRLHLAECQICPDELEDMLQLAALQDELYGDDARLKNPTPKPPPPLPSPTPPLPPRSPSPPPTLLSSSSMATMEAPPPSVPSTATPVGDSSLVPFCPWLVPFRKVAVAVVLAAVAVTVLVVVGAEWRGATGPDGGSTDGPDQAIAANFIAALGETRKIEGRLSYAPADRYRHYDVQRNGTGAVEKIPYSVIAGMEERAVHRGMAAASLLMGNLDRVEEHLDRAGETPDTWSDRALLLLKRGKKQDLEEAVVLLERALAEDPEHAQAWWNRGLVLEALGLELQAAEAFDTVAGFGEEGWSTEARNRARALRQLQKDRKDTWYDLHRRGEIMTRGGRLLTADDVETQPGVVRHHLYEAIRTASDAERVQALRPLAEAVDRAHRTDALGRLVDRVTSSDFSARGPLAREYAVFFHDAKKAQDPVSRPRIEQLLGQLRADDAYGDILLGALRYATPDYRASARYFAEYRELAHNLDDPWFALVADEQEANLLLRRGENHDVIELLTGELESCQSLAFRCVRLEYLLASAYIALNRPGPANRFIEDGWKRARSAKEYFYQLKLLSRLGRVLHMSDDVAGRWFPVVRDYFYERGKREANCVFQYGIHVTLAQIAINANRHGAERREMDRARALVGPDRLCPEEPPMDLERAIVLAFLLRSADGGSASEVSRLRSGLGELRTRFRDKPGHLVLLDHLEGRLLIDRDQDKGQELLEQAIVRAARHSDDPMARKARGYSYSVLVHSVARRGEYLRALELLADEVGLPAPPSCSLGLAREESLLIVARGRDGGVHAAVTSLGPDEMVSDDWTVPPEFVRVLDGCERVDVYARAPFLGKAMLLPGSMAWRFRVARTGDLPSPPAERRIVVVSDIIAPEHLKLDTLRSRHSPAAGAIWIRGENATPTRVLEAISDATEIEIRAHGITELGVTHLVLSPGRGDRDYSLSAEQIRSRTLTGAPVVVLGACEAGSSARYSHESWGLAPAFIEAGARAVFASPAPIQDLDADAFFAAIRDAVARGVEPAVALRDRRQARKLSTGEFSWVDRVVVFE